MASSKPFSVEVFAVVPHSPGLAAVDPGVLAEAGLSVPRCSLFPGVLAEAGLSVPRCSLLFLPNLANANNPPRLHFGEKVPFLVALRPSVPLREVSLR